LSTSQTRSMSAIAEEQPQAPAPPLKRDESLEVSSADESESHSAPVSRTCSSDDLVSKPPNYNKRVESLQERGKIPNSFFVTAASIVLLEGCSGMYKLDTLKSWWSSISTSSATVYAYLEYLRDLMQSAYQGEIMETKEYVVAAITTFIVASLVGIFIYAPFRAGVWTGQRAKRHKVHRYMGLFFLIQYALVWVEFLTKNGGSGYLGVLPHALALNGRYSCGCVTVVFVCLLESIGSFSRNE